MSEAKKKSWYRPEIDGLRALAIIPVLLFHANIAGFAGGFIGVDVFFVISGFLITSIIYRELQLEKFSLVTFWERRLRRIVPVLFFVMMATLVAGYFIILFPVDYLDLGQSVLAQALFLANIFFLRKDDYFAGPAESMPLLHTWSLSLEEQFYILFPLIMMAVWWFARRWLLWVLIGLGIISLLFSQYLLTGDPGASFSIPFMPNVWGGATNATAAFYLLPARAFELLIGAALAVGAWHIKQKTVAEIVSWSGLALVLYAVFFFSEETVFPGIAALVPTLGTAAIILSNTHTQTSLGNLLSFPVFVWIGLISYSLYLWHWPVLVLAKQYLNVHHLDSVTVGGLLVLTFLLSIASYWLVETPFRTKRLCATRGSMIAAGIAMLLVMVAAGFLVMKQNGAPQRAPAVVAALTSATLDFAERRDECFVNAFTRSDDPCLLGPQDVEETKVVLWGDSHGAALLPAFSTLAEDEGVTVATFLAPGCLPIAHDSSSGKCKRVHALADAFITKHDVSTVVLAGRWSGVDTDAEASFTDFSEQLIEQLHQLRLQNIDTRLVLQVPAHYAFNERQLFYEAVRSDALVLPQTTRSEHEMRNQEVNQLFRALAEEGQMKVIDLTNKLCDTEVCRLEEDGVILYQDEDHLNRSGALTLTESFRTLFR